MEKVRAFLVFFLLLFPVSAHAAVEIFAGAEVDSDGQSFSFLGIGSDWPMEGKFSLVGKITAAYLEYKFESGDRTLKAEVPIVTPAVGVRYVEKSYSLQGAIGLDLRETERERPQGGRSEDTDAGLSVEGQARVSVADDVVLGLLASYSTIDDFYWLRARVKKGAYDFGDMRLFAGGEAGAMGNEDFDSIQLGGLLELYYPEVDLSFIVKGGIKNSSAEDSGAYGGVEFYYRF